MDAATQRGDAKFLKRLDAFWIEAERRAGSALACRSGCTECCHGPFPITRLDAARLQLGMGRLAAADPRRAARIRARARRDVSAFAADFPGDPVSGWLGAEEDEGTCEQAFYERHGSRPCPLLNREDGSCELYESRPVTCRTYGPPIQIGVEKLPPCRLCFVGAHAEEVERCRVEPDPEALEDALVAACDPSAPWDDRETLVAYAVAGRRTAPASSE